MIHKALEMIPDELFIRPAFPAFLKELRNSCGWNHTDPQSWPMLQVILLKEIAL
jgi:hypothetical protein